MDATLLRATLGKWVMGIEVLNRDGSSLTLVQAFTRNSLKSVSFLVCGLGCLWVAWSENKQAWHDILAGAYVVRR